MLHLQLKNSMKSTYRISAKYIIYIKEINGIERKFFFSFGNFLQMVWELRREMIAGSESCMAKITGKLLVS